MITLNSDLFIQVPDVRALVQFISWKDVAGDSNWIPLNGQFIPTEKNPKIFEIYGYSLGQTIIDGVDHFKIERMNGGIGAGVGADNGYARFVRPWNSKQSGTRNLQPIDKYVPATLKGHTHSGVSNAAGSHVHANLPGSGLVYTGVIDPGAGGYDEDPGYFDEPGDTGTVGHAPHSHTGTTGGLDPASMPVENIGNTVRPKNFASLFCIYGG